MIIFNFIIIFINIFIINHGYIMNISIKTDDDIAKMRISGRLAAEVLKIIEPYIKPGITTEELDKICYKHITKKQKATSAALGYQGFPKSICTSINEVVCHGIPNIKDKLKEGDIINIDVTVIKNGLYGDTSKMFIVGEPTILSKNLCKVAQNSLYLAIKMVRPGIRLRHLGKKIQQFVEANNFSVVREYCGHGIGKKFHEEPQILHYEADDKGIILESGMAFTIEPMINAGNYHTYTMPDGWTVKTRDNSLSAQYEHTIIVTKNGCEITTLRSDDNLPAIINHQI